MINKFKRQKKSLNLIMAVHLRMEFVFAYLHPQLILRNVEYDIKDIMIYLST